MCLTDPRITETERTGGFYEPPANHLSGLLEQTEKAESIQYWFNTHSTIWKKRQMYWYGHLWGKIRSKFNLEGECCDCGCIFQAVPHLEPCEFCGSDNIASPYFC